MAEPTVGEPTGPLQRGWGFPGQCGYWVCIAHPKEETIQRLGLKVPGDFTREFFSELMVKAHEEVGTDVVETATF